MRDRFAGVLGHTRKREGLWAVESSASADLAGDLSVGSLQSSLFGIGGFLGGGGGLRTYSIQIPISAALPFPFHYYHHHHHYHRRIANWDGVGSINYPSKLVLAPFGSRSCRKDKKGVGGIFWRRSSVVVAVRTCYGRKFRVDIPRVNGYVCGEGDCLGLSPTSEGRVSRPKNCRHWA